MKKIRVHLTVAQVHRIWRQTDDKRSKSIRETWPLERSFTRPGQKPEVVDCRYLTVPFDIAILPPTPPAQRNGKGTVEQAEAIDAPT